MSRVSTNKNGFRSKLYFGADKLRQAVPRCDLSVYVFGRLRKANESTFNKIFRFFLSFVHSEYAQLQMWHLSCSAPGTDAPPKA